MINNDTLVTYFAPAERIPADVINRQSITIQNLNRVRSFIDSMPVTVMIINRQRQVVFYNRMLRDLVDIENEEEMIGLRPGEILRCIHANDLPGGCGTSESCRVCGAVRAILESQDSGRKTYHECRIIVESSRRNDCLDLGITATPIEVEGDQFTIVSVTDISDTKRRRALEHVFFHDVLNTIGGLQGLVEFMAEDPDGGGHAVDLLPDLKSQVKRLVDQINEQQDLMLAENNELKVDISSLESLSLLNEAALHVSRNRAFKGRRVEIDGDSENVLFYSSPRLLYRIIVNMLKNAMEASVPGDIIRAGCRLKDNRVEFWVNNPGTMPREVQLSLFQRYFSTKGPSRGLGTYSMKLLSERYLQGAVSFSVSEEGVYFFARYPLSIEK